MPAAGKATATVTPAWRRRMPWCWSTTGRPAGASCSTSPGASPARYTNASASRWNRSRAWWAHAGERIHARPCRRPDAGEHGVLRVHGHHDPAGVGNAAHLPGRVLPLLLRDARHRAAGLPARPGPAAHAAAAALRGALPDRHPVDAVRLLGHRQPAAGAGGVAVVLDPAVRHHR